MSEATDGRQKDHCLGRPLVHLVDWPPCLGPRGDEDITELLTKNPCLDEYAEALSDHANLQPGKPAIFFVRVESIMDEACREIKKLRSIMASKG